MFMSSLRSVYRKTRSLLRGSRPLNVCWGDMDLFWPSSSSNEQNTFSKVRQISVQRSKPTDNRCISTNLPAVDRQDANKRSPNQRSGQNPALSEAIVVGEHVDRG